MLRGKFSEIRKMNLHLCIFSNHYFPKIYLRMKSTFSLLMIALMGISLTSCLTFEETYEFKNNGSGFMQYVVDMSEMADLLKMSDDENTKFKQEDLSFSDIVGKLKTIEGISSVSEIRDEENYRFGINYKFANINSLNQALNTILMDEKEGGANHVFFEKKGNTYDRTHLMTKSKMADRFFGDEDMTEQTQALLQSVNYKINYKFARPIKVVYSSAETKLMGKKNKSVDISTSFKHLLKNKEALNTSIVLK